MTSSNVIAEPSLMVEAPAGHTPEAIAGSQASPTASAPSPFELLPVGEAFGVCDLDGECR